MTVYKIILLTLACFAASVALCGHMSSAAPLPQEALTALERRGKQIYQRGISASGETIVAGVGDASLEVPGNLMACANCHGMQGQGKTEAGIRPTNLSWDLLSSATRTGRIHPGYNEQTLGVAITQGRDPAGNKLLTAMPRFQMSSADLTDLIAYIKRVNKDRDPGVEPNRIVIATILPKGSLATMGTAIKAVLSGYFNEINNQGGIYGRNLDLKFVEVGDTPAATAAAVEQLIKTEGVFAFAGAFIAGSEKEVVGVMEQHDVPLIGPLTLYPPTENSATIPVFYVLAGIPDQVRVLVDFAVKQSAPKEPNIVIVYSRNEVNLASVDAIVEEAGKNKAKPPQLFEYLSSSFSAADLTKKAQAAQAQSVFLLGTSNEALAFLKESEKLNWFPDVYVTASASGAELFQAPVAFDRKIFISFPTSPQDATKAGTDEFRALAAKYNFPSQHVAAQLSTYSAAKILVAGLKGAGKDLGRMQLIRALETMNNFDTGLTPPVSYGPRRRTGAMGAYVITVDLKNKQYTPASSWIPLN